MYDEHMRYLGVLGLLAHCSVYLPNDGDGGPDGMALELRDSIERAMEDACRANPGLRWRRIINRIEIYSAPAEAAHEAAMRRVQG